MKKILIILTIILMLMPCVLAKQGHMTLLAVKEDINKGSAADLYLEMQPGSGRVFIETFPLSKLDTQISTRFAKEIACDYLEVDCDRYDFFYTIRADSSIIGGPSAGGAIAVLTAAMLSGSDINQDIAMTGTINSGGLIGPVGGIKAKIDAAGAKKIKKVLVPKGGRFVKEEGNLTPNNESTNLTLDLKEYSKKYNMELIEVTDLTDALYYFTGKKFKEDSKELKIDKDYKDTMELLAKMLCNRTSMLQKKVNKSADKSIIDEDYGETEKDAINLTNKGNTAFKKEEYYSAASYCFGANSKYMALYLKSHDINDLNELMKGIKEFDDNISKTKIKTITDLEAYMVVRERLKEAMDSLNRTIMLKNEGKNYSKELAYTIERSYSAESWSKFFGVKGKEFELNKEELKNSCISKLAEVEERFQYVQLFLPGALVDTKKEIEYATEDYAKGDYELCLFKASIAKAEVDVILGTMGVEEEHVNELLDAKLTVAKRVIVEEQEKGAFPILGYSYYEYANSLKDYDIYSALLYSEYALELSKLDMYFKEKRLFEMPHIDSRLILFLIGAAAGFLIGFGIFYTKKPKKKKAVKRGKSR